MGKQPNKKSNKKKIIIFWCLIVSPVFLFLIVMWAANSGSLGFKPLPSLEELENPKSNLASEIITADGKVIGKYFLQNRTNVKYGDLSPHLVDALIATEDARFENHSGIDFRGLMRAVIYMGSAGGASTITQQLAKMMFNDPAQTFVERIKQKIQEQIIAVELEKRYTKNEIIAMYFNQFDFLNNAVGIESAAGVYFNKSPKDLELHEAAMLVGMAKNPSLFNPLRRPEKVLKRREVVLSQMKTYGYLTQEQYDSVRVLPLDLDYKVVDHKEGIAPYFRETLRLKLQEMLAQKDEEGNYIYAKSDGEPYNIYKDGLKIYTTLNSKMQEYAEWAVEEYIAKTLQPQFDKHLKKYRTKRYPFDGGWKGLNQEQFEAIMETAMKRTPRYRILMGKECQNCSRRGKVIDKEGNYYVCQAEDCGYKKWATDQDSIPVIFDKKVSMKVFSHQGAIDTTLSPMDSIKYYKTFLHTGLMSVDPHTGYIKAWVGGVNYQNFAYDHVTSTRQVGSTFKPFVYAAAIQEKKLSPCQEVPNLPVTFHKGEFGLLKDWTPKNSDGDKDGCPVSLKYALANSMNTITAWTMRQITPQHVVDLARVMGISTNLEPVPSLCLGVADISVMEMVAANATFANKGVYIEPTMFTRVEDKHGNVIIDVTPNSNEAMNEETAYVMLNLMKGVTSGVYNECKGKALGTGMRLRGVVSKSRPYVGHRYTIAGKTGTTQNNSDGWFMGITPDLVTGVWVGAEDRAVRFATTNMGQGANTALPIWGYYMQKVMADKALKISKEDFEKPDKPLSIELDCNKYKEMNGKDNYGGAEF